MKLHQELWLVKAELNQKGLLLFQIHGFLSVIKYGHAQRDSAAPYWTDNDNTTFKTLHRL